MKRKYSCKFPNCENYYAWDKTGMLKNKRFYKFPKDNKPELSNEWKAICNISANRRCESFYICEDHFNEEDFIGVSRFRLKSNAIPKRELCKSNVLPKHSNSEFSYKQNVQVSLIESTSNVPSCSRYDPRVPNIFDTEMSIIEDELLSESEDQGKSVNDITVNECIMKNELPLKKCHMYEIHCKTITKISRLTNTIGNRTEHLKYLQELYHEGKLKFIEEDLGELSESFIDLQFKNFTEKAPFENWTLQAKTTALSLYTCGPSLYKYLSMYFNLPSVRLLKSIISQIPFDTGLNPFILEVLKTEVKRLHHIDTYCGLLFDEISLMNEMEYAENEQTIYDHQNCDHINAKYALVFMVRGLRKAWKQVVAYYFTSSTISSYDLKNLIKEIVFQLQSIGLNVVNTVCDQNPTYQRALRELCEETIAKPSKFYFAVNDKPIVTIWDVPHLLINTRNTFMNMDIEFEESKVAKFEYVKNLFDMDCKKKFKTLPKLKEEDFNFEENCDKTKFKTAVAQLSNTVAAGIETLVLTKFLPPEAIYTAEFINLVNCLFDSLNGHHLIPPDGKRFQCVLKDHSPHLQLWSNLLIQLQKWSLVEKKTLEKDIDCFSFIEGWRISIKAVIFLWKNLKNVGFRYLNLRSLNKDPLENLFCCIKQYSVNTNPTCFQFIRAMKTCTINNYVMPLKNPSNREGDSCILLNNLNQFLLDNYRNKNIEDVPVL